MSMVVQIIRNGRSNNLEMITTRAKYKNFYFYIYYVHTTHYIFIVGLFNSLIRKAKQNDGEVRTVKPFH